MGPDLSHTLVVCNLDFWSATDLDLCDNEDSFEIESNENKHF